MRKGTILSIDDDSNLQLVISHYLEDDGYMVETAASMKEALAKLGRVAADVILLDLVLPDGEGLSLIPQIHQKSEAGIIVVSGKDDTTEKIICLEMGADDYITKPFEMRELSARIKAVSRRREPREDDRKKDLHKTPTAREKFGRWVLDRAQYQAFDEKGRSLELTTGEFQLLDALVSSPARALSREQLFDLTREGHFDSYDRAIDIQVARIRKKLGNKNNEIIKTVRGIGYMYAGEPTA